MAGKLKKPLAPTKERAISSETTEGRARLATMPEVNGAMVMDAFCKSLGAQSVQELMVPLHENVEAVRGGDLAGAEAMLISQAHALQTIFAELSRRAALNMGEYLGAMETYMRLALKAQAQCTRTLETLAVIKNPPIVYARQANVTTGPQQINNGAAALSRAREIETEQTQLSGENHELLPDARASGDASRVNLALETLGEIDRAEVTRG